MIVVDACMIYNIIISLVRSMLLERYRLDFLLEVRTEGVDWFNRMVPKVWKRSVRELRPLLVKKTKKKHFITPEAERSIIL